MENMVSRFRIDLYFYTAFLVWLMVSLIPVIVGLLLDYHETVTYFSDLGFIAILLLYVFSFIPIFILTSTWVLILGIPIYRLFEGRVSNLLYVSFQSIVTGMVLTFIFAILDVFILGLELIDIIFIFFIGALGGLIESLALLLGSYIIKKNDSELSV